MKQCNKCGLYKELSEYSKKSSKKDGLSSTCKSCISIRSKEYYNKNREVLIKKNSKYFSINKEKIYETKRKWYSENIEYITEQQRKRYKTVEYKIGRKIRKHNRRSLEKQAYNDGSITRKSLINLMISQNYECGYCGCEINENYSHLDHITPISKGGSNTLENVHWTCPRCNLSKGSKSHDEFLMLLGSSPKQ